MSERLTRIQHQQVNVFQRRIGIVMQTFRKSFLSRDEYLAQVYEAEKAIADLKNALEHVQTSIPEHAA